MAVKKTKKPKQLAKVAKTGRTGQPSYKSFKVSRRIKHPKVLPSSFQIFSSTIKLLKGHFKLFITITLIYGLLTILLVRGIGGSLNLSELKDNLQAGFNGDYSSLATGATLFGYLVGSAGASASPSGSTYQTMLIILLSVVTIWSLREVLAGHKIKAKDAFYKGVYPLVPFIIVLLVVTVQLIPLLFGTWIYSVAIGTSIALSSVEKLIWASMALALAVLSLYMISSSVFACYIVTLPDMTPMKALRSARRLVLHRRWAVMRKVLFLPFVLLIITAALMFPFIFFATAIAEWVFFGLTMFTLVAVHAYMYTLYRELL